MKCYIILIPRIGGLGGAQIYVQNKLRYLEHRGWETYLFYSYDDNLLLSGLKNKGHKIEELSYSTYLYSPKKVEKVIDTIIGILPNSSHCVIESTCMQQALWGELIAEKLQSRHLVYLLQEKNEILDYNWYKFLIFKHKRRELVSINETSLQDMFKPYKEIPLERSYVLDALSANVVQDYDYPKLNGLDFAKYDYIVGCLSRLDKPFVIPCLKQFKDYAINLRNKSFLLIVIGSSSKKDSKENDIKRLFRGLPNIRLVLAGTIYPLPRKLLRACDVFLCSAGCTLVTEAEGIPTITYDTNDHLPIGLYNITTNKVTLREDEPPVSLALLLDQVLVEKKYKKKTNPVVENNLDFSSHLEFVKNGDSKKVYFPVREMKPCTEMDKRLKIQLSFLGTKWFNRLAKLKMRILRHG